VEYGGLLSEDEDEVIVVDELIEDEDSEALELAVEESPGYDTGSDWLELSELDESDDSVIEDGV
jgi:hypothetical protein